MSAHQHVDAHRWRAEIAWLTVSDTRTESEDHSAIRARGLIETEGHRVVAYAIVPDEPEQVRERVGGWLRDDTCNAVIVSGGSGISARDRTYEALERLLDKRLDGFGELFRMLSHEKIGSAAMLSRAVGGVASGKPLFSLPGSTAAVELALTRLILPELSHLLSELNKHKIS